MSREPSFILALTWAGMFMNSYNCYVCVCPNARENKSQAIKNQCIVSAPRKNSCLHQRAYYTQVNTVIKRVSILLLT